MFESIFPVTDPVVIFAIVACLLLVIPFAMEKVGMPSVVGLLIAGAVLGPNALHVLSRDQSFVLLGKVGLIFIMFTAALEVDLAVFKRFGLHAVVFGLLTFSLPQGLGTPAAFHLFDQFDWLAATLLASIFASHTLLAYPIASRLGISKNRAVTTAVGGTMVTDTAALLVLAVVAGMSKGEVGEAFWWRLGVSLAIYVSVIFFGLPKLGRWLFRRASEDGVAQFAFVLASVFVCAALSHAAGVEPIVGAFLAGLALNRLIPHNGTLMNRIVFIGDAIFVPFFLLSVGMLLDARVLFGGLATWKVMGFMIVMVTVTKFLAAESTRLFLRFTKDEARVVFGLSIPQAAATLAAVMVGFNLGLFDETVVNGSIMMILATCVLGPYFVSKHGPKIAAMEAAKAEVPTGPRQRVLVALRDLVTAQSVVELSLLLRDAVHAQPLFLVHAARDDAQLSENVIRGEKMLHDAVTLCSAADVPASVATVVDESIGAALARSNKQLQGSHLVLDWDCQPPNGEGVVLGSAIDDLLEMTECTVVLSRSRHPIGTTRKISLALPPMSGPGEELEAAMKTVWRIAQQLGAPVEVLAQDEVWARCRETVEAAMPSVDVSAHSLESWPSLLQALRERTSTSDLLVVASARSAPLDVARAPLQVGSRFPDASIVCVYGAVSAAASRLGVIPTATDADLEASLA
jgi:Kef-type K+ transport system membrane component KefB